MAGRLYRMAKVVSSNAASWGIVDATEISGFRRVAKLTDLYSIAECILSSSYGDGVTDGVDAVGQIWYVAETNADYKLINWDNRKSAAGWSKLTYGGDVSIPVKDVKVNNTSVVSGGVANINLSSYATTATTDTLTKNLGALQTEIGNVSASVGNIKNKIGANGTVADPGIATLVDGKVPLKQLGNIDTTFCEVVPELPSSLDKIKKHIYLVTATTTGDKQSYAEYIYTGGITANDVYDANNWEKLGDVEPSVDLKNYYTKSEVDTKTTTLLNNIDEAREYAGNKANDAVDTSKLKSFTATIEADKEDEQAGTNTVRLTVAQNGGTSVTVKIPNATLEKSGSMSKTDKTKLDGIASGANKYTHPTYTAAEEGLYKVTVDELGHVSKTTAVTKSDITNLGIPASAPTVDTAMSDTSTNAVQNKVIDNAIKTHIINSNNLLLADNIASDKLAKYVPVFDMDNDAVAVSNSGTGYYIINDPNDLDLSVPVICYSSDGASQDSVLLRDIDVVALTDTEINNILK